MHIYTHTQAGEKSVYRYPPPHSESRPGQTLPTVGLGHGCLRHFRRDAAAAATAAARPSVRPGLPAAVVAAARGCGSSHSGEGRPLTV